MTKSRTIIIDPCTDARTPELFMHGKSADFIRHYEPTQSYYTKPDELKNYAFINPLVRFEKPIRTSKTTGKLKPKGTYIAVLDPEPIGSGAFGALYPVLGTWKLTPDGWVYKTKNDPSKIRLMKSNGIHLIKFHEPDNVQDSYEGEQEIGQWVKHMGLKYPPVTYGDYSFLLMRKQPGIPLSKLIDGLYANPALLSATDRLKITVNLLIALETQVHGVKVGTKLSNDDGAYIIHRDIKPDNIIIEDDYTVKFIDYGLAKYNFAPDDFAGTADYMDPQIIITNYHTNKATDLASLARVIADIWGDTSRELIEQALALWQLCKSENYGPNLLTNIPNLSPAEFKELYPLITAMLSDTVTDRPSREEALTHFSRILVKHLTDENSVNQKHATDSSVDDLSGEQLVAVFNSPYAHIFLNRLQENPQESAKLIAKMGIKILELKQATLDKLKTMRINFSELIVSLSLIESEELSSRDVAKLISLGANVAPNSLKDWIKRPLANENHYYWASICHLLFNATPNAASIVSSFDLTNFTDFKSLYCQCLLQSDDKIENDKRNVQIIQRTIEIRNQYLSTTKQIQTLMNRVCKGTALETAIQTSEAFKIPALFFDVQLTDIYDALYQWSSMYYDVDYLIDQKIEIPARKKLLENFFTAMEKRRDLDDTNWEDALFDTRAQKAEIERISTLDNIYQVQLKRCPAVFAELFTSQFGTYYESANTTVNQVAENASSFIEALRVIDSINAQRKVLRDEGLSLPGNSGIESGLSELIEKADINEAQLFLTKAKFYYASYTHCTILFKKIHNQIAESPDSNRGQLLKRIYSTFIEHCISSKQDSLKEIETLNTLVQQEKHFKNNLSYNPASLSFIYGIIRAHIHKTGRNSIDYLIPFFERINTANLLDKAILLPLDNCLNTIKTIKNSQSNREDQLAQLKKGVWRFLLNPHDDMLRQDQVNRQLIASFTQITQQTEARAKIDSSAQSQRLFAPLPAKNQEIAIGNQNIM